MKTWDAMEDSISPVNLHDHQRHIDGSKPGSGGEEDSSRKKTNVRKRTKTGCLTCRKRRIKCDEGRPTCNNCIKSKRSCEGYSKNVVWKDPIGAVHGPYGSTVYAQGSSHLASHLAGQQVRSLSQGPLPLIAPRPPQQFGHYDDQHGFPYTSSGPRPLGAVATLDPNFDTSYAHGLASQTNRNEGLPNPLVSPHDSQSHAHAHHGFPTEGVNLEHARQGGQGFQSTKHANNFEQDLPPANASQYAQSGQWQRDDSDVDDSLPESEDEDLIPQTVMMPVLHRHPSHVSGNGTHVRSFSRFAHSSAVSEYMSSPYTTTLSDRGVRILFMHFINVTGPGMSLYERQPFQIPEYEPYGSDAKVDRNLWTYTFPIIALQHPSLLHAMLAIASLQIANMRDNPPTAAMKHYHIAIRRVAKNVNSPSRRTQPATLAATLLLGYFEVWQSEHTKWCCHLSGARILFKETPLRSMSRACLPVKRMRQRQRRQERQRQNVYADPFAQLYHVAPEDEIDNLDYSLLSIISGQEVKPEDYGLAEGQYLTNSATEKDIELYENLRDLFWWYCKMDVYQSILGGTKLFMEYEAWTQCPPRAAVSKSDGICGTYDHLLLLLGRIADFSSKDLARKRKAARAQGGPPGGSSPPFPGMLPNRGRVQVPMGFDSRDGSPRSDSHDESEADISQETALSEWEKIRKAFEAFESKLGPEFRQLSPEYADRRESPFGATLQYTTFAIAGIWMNYYMGMIHLYRSHPSMPPAAMQAAGLSARQTAGYANQIGRIAAGLSEDCTRAKEISTLVGAAFIESAFCLFVAGVQLQDEAQRHWLVRRMHDISRLTGWMSARQIADGCESAWTKAAKFGRGPPYVQDPAVSNIGKSIWLNPRRINERISEFEPREERRLVLARSEQAHYAMGLLAVEEELSVLELRDKD